MLSGKCGGLAGETAINKCVRLLLTSYRNQRWGVPFLETVLRPLATQPTVPKWIIFDFHGVLADFGPFGPWMIEQAAGRDDLAAALHQLETGELRITDFLRCLPADIRLPRASSLRARPEMVAALGSLRARGFRLALLTNTFRGFSAFRARAGLPDDMFDLAVESWRMRVRKPDPAIFTRTLEELGARPAECLFIDDQTANVLAAARLGFRVIHATTAQATLMLIDSHCRTDEGSL
jgi:epoxide hydrolase-like predicted phosphatase